MTKFLVAKLTGVSINLKTNEIRLGAEITLTPENQELAEELKPYLGEEGGYVELSITPRQMVMNLPAGSKVGKG